MERNDLLSVVSQQTTVFRGDEWSCLSLNIKASKTLISSHCANGRKYYLSARLESVNDKNVEFETAIKSGRVEMVFAKGNRLDQQWNELTCKLKTCLLESRDQFRVLVEIFELDEEHERENQKSIQAVFYGASQRIT